MASMINDESKPVTFDEAEGLGAYKLEGAISGGLVFFDDHGGVRGLEARLEGAGRVDRQPPDRGLRGRFPIDL